MWRKRTTCMRLTVIGDSCAKGTMKHQSVNRLSAERRDMAQSPGSSERGRAALKLINCRRQSKVSVQVWLWEMSLSDLSNFSGFSLFC